MEARRAIFADAAAAERRRVNVVRFLQARGHAAGEQAARCRQGAVQETAEAQQDHGQRGKRRTDYEQNDRAGATRSY